MEWFNNLNDEEKKYIETVFSYPPLYKLH